MSDGDVNNKQAGEPVAEASRPSTDSPSSRVREVTPGGEGASDAQLGSGPADLPDFELLAEIGRGGFGSVWIAKHRHTCVSRASPGNDFLPGSTRSG